ELADVALLGDELLLAPRRQVELVDLRDAAEAVAVLGRVLRAQGAEIIVVRRGRFDRVIDRVGLWGVVKRTRPAGDARQRSRFATLTLDAPHLWRAVVRRLGFAGALAVAQETDRATIRAPLRVALISPVEGQPPRRRLAVGRDDPQVGPAHFIALVPSRLAIGD